MNHLLIVHYAHGRVRTYDPMSFDECLKKITEIYEDIEQVPEKFILKLATRYMGSDKTPGNP